MLPLSRFTRALAIFSTALAFTGMRVYAQDAAAPAAPAAAAPAAAAPAAAAPAGAPAAANFTMEPLPDVPQTIVFTPLRQAAEDFWHYAKIGRYDQAVPKAQVVLASGASDVDVLDTLQAVVADHQDDMMNWLLKWQLVDSMKDVTTQLLKKVHDGTVTRVQDPAYIKQQIERLATNERAYGMALSELRRSGELCVPLMIDYLRDPGLKQYHPSIRRALVDLGRQALNPLVAATEMREETTRITLIKILGDIGYDAAWPYLAKLANGTDIPGPVQDAATGVLVRVGAGDVKNLNVPQMFYDLGEKFYYNNAAIAADKRNPVAYIWTWDEPNGRLKPTVVPPGIFNDVMAMRACEYGLKLDAAAHPDNVMMDTVSLWLAANYKREAELPDGQKDNSRPDGYPSAHYWGVAYGTPYLERVVDRALKDRNSAVALKSIQSLQDIAGQSNLYSEEHQPMLDALRYPDRLVRFEAAFALGSGLPQKSFRDQDRVIPIFADALAQTGKPSAVIIAPSQDQLNQLTESMKSAGYVVQGGTTPDAAMAAVNAMPGVDVLVVSERLDVDAMDHLLTAVSENQRLERVPRVFVIASLVSPWAARSIDDPLVNVVRDDDATALAPAVNAARARSGSLPLDEKTSTDYALRAAAILEKLAISRGQIFDLMVAEPQLLAALDDARPEVAKASANVVGLLNSKKSQQALVVKASDDKVPDDVRIALYKATATSAKFFGCMLESDQIDALQKAVETAPNLDVRSAAAEARGSLNVPIEKTQELIVNQSRVPFISGHD